MSVYISCGFVHSVTHWLDMRPPITMAAHVSEWWPPQHTQGHGNIIMSNIPKERFRGLKSVVNIYGYTLVVCCDIVFKLQFLSSF